MNNPFNLDRIFKQRNHDDTASHHSPKESVLTSSTPVDTFKLAGRTVKRMGYGAMQLAGPNVFGPPKDRDAAIAVLREAVASGVDHIDTSDFYGPHVTNQIIREALHPYRDDLVIEIGRASCRERV